MFDRACMLSEVLLVSISLLGGCTANRADLKQMNQLRIETASTKSVLIEEPSVWQEDGRTVVCGRIKRAPEAFTVGAGHTHVQVQWPDKGVTEEQRIPWSPKWIPFRNPQYSTYRATYPWIAPHGSRVHVWVCFSEHPPIMGGNIPTTRPQSDQGKS